MELLESARGHWADHRTLEFAVDYSGKPLSDRLTRLTEKGLFARRPARVKEQGRSGYEHRLTVAGEALLELRAHMIAAMVALDATEGERAELLAAAVRSEWDRVVGRVVLRGPQSFSELQGAARGLARSWGMQEPELDNAGLTRTLRRLQQLGLVAAEPGLRRTAKRYVRGPDMWRLAPLAVEASLWCCIHTPQRIPPLAGDLLGLIEMIVDRVRVEADLGPATLVLHVQPPEGVPGWFDVPLCVEEGRLQVLPAAPLSPSAHVEASLQTWCEALRSGDSDALTIRGQRPIADSVLAAVTATIPWPLSTS